ncbi:hypothetical protein [Aminobacter sp. MET-1]|uniref:hypothetical protein n=1 Tax=Aminobacter sp. MET-1 TaxID=2951085 RepID=UPI00226A3631|nr:hypothetical protein [Aminobacter sp. MET-1]MCX8570770.1 hypothetical protein [Aminobacter sp. MET-1]
MAMIGSGEVQAMQGRENFDNPDDRYEGHEGVPGRDQTKPPAEDQPLPDTNDEPDDADAEGENEPLDEDIDQTDGDPRRPE